MSQITTHVLDTALGIPAGGINVVLSTVNRSGEVALLAEGLTDDNGRISDLLTKGKTLAAGDYQVRFELEEYFKKSKQVVFYPYAEIVFRISGDGGHYHIPLLLSPYGYSTYRGS